MEALGESPDAAPTGAMERMKRQPGGRQLYKVNTLPLVELLGIRKAVRRRQSSTTIESTAAAKCRCANPRLGYLLTYLLNRPIPSHPKPTQPTRLLSCYRLGPCFHSLNNSAKVRWSWMEGSTNPPCQTLCWSPPVCLPAPASSSVACKGFPAVPPSFNYYDEAERRGERIGIRG